MHEPTNATNTTPSTDPDPDPDEAVRVSRVIGTAAITPAAGKPVATPYYSAAAALRWPADHSCNWEFASHIDPGVRYPPAVLTAAQAEARDRLPAGTIYPEAANLSDAVSPDVPRPNQHSFERLRDNAIHTARTGTITTPTELAAAVAAQLTPDITVEQTAALIWHDALVRWRAAEP